MAYVYPNYPKQLLLKDNRSIVIGDNYTTHPDQNVSPFNFGDVIEPDFSDFDISIHNTEQTAYRYEVFVLKNGYKLVMDMWFSQAIMGVTISSHWLNENGVNADMELVGIAGRYGFSIGSQGQNYSYFDWSKPKIFLSAQYPTNTISGVSEADSFIVALYFPTSLTRYIGIDQVTLYNNLEQMTSRNRTERQYLFTVPYGSDRYPCFPAYAPLGLAGIYFDTFATFIRTHGDSFEGDVYDMSEPDPEPAGGTDYSGTGGGGGNYDDTSDPIDFPNNPVGGALESGAVVGHLVMPSDIKQLLAKLWSLNIFDISNWQKLLQDPMEAIVSLHAIPVLPSVSQTGDRIWLGNFDTGIDDPKVLSQYVTIDCGSLNVKEYWGSALDYSPYTRAEIFLPFCGVKDLAIEDVMKNTIHIKYNVDVLTGSVVAFVKCGISVLYHFTGNCRMSIPLSSISSDAILTTINETGKILTTAAVGGAVGGPGAALAGATISSAANVASSKIRTTKSGDLSGSVSLLDDFVPYLILHRPVQSLAKDYNKFKGYPSNITSLLGNLTGYTEVEHIHLEGISDATEAEMNEIVSLLKQGVII